MRLFSELQQCRDDQFPQRVAMLERLHEAWKFDQLVPITRSSSSEADSDDAAFARDVALLHSPAGYLPYTVIGPDLQNVSTFITRPSSLCRKISLRSVASIPMDPYAPPILMKGRRPW